MAQRTEEDLQLAPADAGVAFKAEMAVTNFLLGYWKHLLATIALVLFSILLYSQYRDWNQRSQRELSARLAEAQRDLPASVVELPEMMQFGGVQPELLASTADRVMAVARDGRGTMAVEGLLEAAELYRLAGKPAEQRAALEEAAGQAKGVLRYAAIGALANLDLEEGQGDEAVSRLRELMSGYDGFLAQRAALDLGMALEHLGRGPEAAQVYSEFLQKWPNSPATSEVQARTQRLGTPE